MPEFMVSGDRQEKLPEGLLKLANGVHVGIADRVVRIWNDSNCGTARVLPLREQDRFDLKMGELTVAYERGRTETIPVYRHGDFDTPGTPPARIYKVQID